MTYDFGFGERYDFEVIPAANIGLTKNQPGIYAWFARIPKPTVQTDNPVARYYHLFTQQTMLVNAIGNFRRQFEGTVWLKPENLERERLSPYALSAVTAVFSPLLYMGHSKTIRTRLERHHDALTTCLTVRCPGRGEATFSSDILEHTDTDDESRLFGERIGKALREAGLKSTLSIFVKVMYLLDLDQDQREATEYVFNRIFTPIYGRR